MGSKERIGLLESLLTRIRGRAAEPRPTELIAVEAAAPVAPVAAVAAAPVPSIDAPATAPPPAEAMALRGLLTVAAPPAPPPPPTPTPIPEAPPPMESRARLVAAEERSAGDDAPEVLELDDRHVVQDDGEVSVVSVEETEATEAELLGESAEIETAPPSSKRPIAEPIIEPMPIEAPKHTPPPESGKQVAALSFDDDFTGVRGRPVAQPPIEADLSGEGIPLASQRPPVVAVKDEMEADLPIGGQAPFTDDLAPPTPKPPSKPPSVRLPSERPAPALAMEPEVIKPVIAVANAATFEGAAPAFKPSTFAELLEASLSL